MKDKSMELLQEAAFANLEMLKALSEILDHAITSQSNLNAKLMTTKIWNPKN